MISKVAGSAFCAASVIVVSLLMPTRQQHEAVLVHRCLPSRRDEDGGLERFDHDRTRHFQSGWHPAAIVDCGLDLAGFPEPELALRLDRVGPGRGGRVADRQRRDRADRSEANADDLYRLVAIIM